MNISLVKWTVEKFDVFVYNGVRYIIALIVITLIYFYRYKWKTIERKDILKIIGLGLMSNVVYQMSFIVGIRRTTAGNAAILLSTAPVWTVIFSSIFYKTKFHKSFWFGLLISFFGIIIFNSKNEFSFGNFEKIFGDILLLFGAMIWALYTVLQKPLFQKYDAIHLTFIMMIVGAIGLTSIAFPSMLNMNWKELGIEYYFATILSATFAIAIAYFLWSQGVQHIGAAETGNFNNLVPVLALVFSYFTLKEELDFTQIIGAVFTIFGVWLSRRKIYEE